MSLNEISYKGRPIASVDSLARALHVSRELLEYGISVKDECYRENPQRKPDGSLRLTFSVRNPLKMIQQRILCTVLQNIDFPVYLMGGIRDRLLPRDYVRSAAIHARAREVIGEDVTQFFPSIHPGHVRSAFQHLFRFPPPVAELLTRACTFRNMLPQGACTSSYIANVVLYDVEPALVAALEAEGFSYDRYYDDINVSHTRVLTASERQIVVTRLHRMLHTKGFAPKRRKHEIARTSRAARVHGLNLNAGRPTIPKKNRRAVRAAVHHLLVGESQAGDTPEHAAALDSAEGRAHTIARLHRAEGNALLVRIREMKRKRR